VTLQAIKPRPQSNRSQFQPLLKASTRDGSVASKGHLYNVNVKGLLQATFGALDGAYIKALKAATIGFTDYATCCENDKEHSELVGHHLLGCLLDAIYNPYIPMSYQ
jgi:hypothetical protein